MADDPILAALTDRRFAEALEAALGWWRERPVAPLGDVIGRLGARVPDDGVTHALRTAPRTTVNRLRASLEAVLDRAGDDPRLTDALIDAVREPVGDLDSEGGRALCALVARHLTATADGRAHGWHAQLDAFLHARRGTRRGQLSPEEIGVVRAALAPVRPAEVAPPTAAEQARLDAIVAALDALDRASGDDEAQGHELLAAVAADFADDGPKHVYADWLLERGDPFGEFLQLSLRRELDAAGKRRLKALQPVANERYGAIPGRTLDRGFPVRSFSADKYGARKGTYGTGWVWATIEATDLVPTDDACRTDRLVELHVGSTFVPDLAKLTRPLAVHTLVMTSFAASALPAWKKVRVLPEVRTVRMPVADADAIRQFLLRTPVGGQVRTLQLYQTEPMFAAATSLLVGAVARVEVGALVAFVRDGDRLRAEATIDGPGAARWLSACLTRAAEPLADEAVVRSAVEDLGGLSMLARSITVAPADSGTAARAERVRDGDTLGVRIAERDQLDPPALRALLAAEAAPPAYVTVAGRVDLRQVNVLWATARERGVDGLTVVRTPWDAGEDGMARIAGALRVTARTDRLEVQLDHVHSAPLLERVLHHGPWPRVRLVLGPAMSEADVEAVRVLAATHAPAVEVERTSQADRCDLVWVGKRKRLEIVVPDEVGPLQPDSVDVLLSRHPPSARRGGETAPVAVIGRVAPLAAWVPWVAARQRAIQLYPAPPPVRMAPAALSWTGTGVVAEVPLWTLRHLVLTGLPDGALERLVLVGSGPGAHQQRPDWFAGTAERVAAAYEIR